jgi:molybdopterin-guanine dinucleotide biosynthesis protein MobB
MDVDKPGKDSYELRKAGAAQTMVASSQRWALMTETPDEHRWISLIWSAGWIIPRWIWCWLRV